jgi:hypothetical protein
METIFATQQYNGYALFAFYDWVTSGIWTDIPMITTSWTDL